MIQVIQEHPEYSWLGILIVISLGIWQLSKYLFKTYTVHTHHLKLLGDVKAIDMKGSRKVMCIIPYPKGNLLTYKCFLLITNFNSVQILKALGFMATVHKEDIEGYQTLQVTIPPPTGNSTKIDSLYKILNQKTWFWFIRD